MAKPRVMIVDDANLVRRYFRDALEPAGFEVDEALNGLEALEMLLGAPVDLLIVDVNMPRMDGMSFVKALREKDEPIGSTPVLMASTEAKPADMNAARVAGANFYVTKPVKPDELVAYAKLLTGTAL